MTRKSHDHKLLAVFASKRSKFTTFRTCIQNEVHLVALAGEDVYWPADCTTRKAQTTHIQEHNKHSNTPYERED